MDTIGDLVDKLSIANIRLWHIEDDRRVAAKMDTVTLEETRRLLAAVADVNKERNSLIDQINAYVSVLARGGDGALTIGLEDIVGRGKNKYYKTEGLAAVSEEHPA
jgi:hypothetical protein